MIQTTRAARLEYRLHRLPGYEEARVRYVTSVEEYEGGVDSWAGAAFYLFDPVASPPAWYWIGKYIDGADHRIRQIERAERPRKPAPSPSEVLGVVIQVVGAVFGVVRDVVRR